MKIFFVTGNKGKFMEVQEIMKEQGIEVEQIEIDKPEIKSDSIKEIVQILEKYKKEQI